MIPARRILLIDDNDDQRSLLANVLRTRGWSVEVARNAKQGLEAAARVQPEVVLTELILPDIRGFKFARSLRDVVRRDLIVIALTRIPVELHGRALSSGFDHVLPKPFSVDELHERMVAMPQPAKRAS